MSYIIKNNRVIAKIKDQQFPSGQDVFFSGSVCEERIDAARDYNLVGARHGKVSNAKKWDAVWAKMDDCQHAVEINPGEFQII